MRVCFMRLVPKIKNVLFAVTILILSVVAIYGGLQILESPVFSKTDVVQDQTVSKTIQRDGVSYFPKQDITTLLVMGIDEFGKPQDSGSYNNSGTADVVFLAVFNDTNKKYSILSLNRDTMLDMPVLGIGGKRAGTRYAQLGLAHTYGNGLESSCANVAETVSAFLYGTSVDYYLSMRMDAIAIINDAVGGVEVSIEEEDYLQIDSTLQSGTVRLNGQQALNYIRARKGVGDQLNLSRMERQEKYLQGFSEALQRKSENNSSLQLDIYEKVSDYIITNCSTSTLSKLTGRFSEYELSEVIIPQGEYVRGEEFMEYYVDQDALDDVILRLLYSPKK